MTTLARRAHAEDAGEEPHAEDAAERGGGGGEASWAIDVLDILGRATINGFLSRSCCWDAEGIRKGVGV